MDYQLKLQGSNNSFQPCLALICSKGWAQIGLGPGQDPVWDSETRWGLGKGQGMNPSPLETSLWARAPEQGAGVRAPNAGWLDPSPPLHPSALPAGPYYHGNPGAESKISPFWVMPPPEVSAQSPQARRLNWPWGPPVGSRTHHSPGWCPWGSQGSLLQPRGPRHCHELAPMEQSTGGGCGGAGRPCAGGSRLFPPHPGIRSPATAGTQPRKGFLLMLGCNRPSAITPRCP